jgi:UDP-2,4-diacetamido-2,4,6-trideoxy-beta-L-altropyranose hydrolase
VIKTTFVTAASPQIGGGHVLRGLALAEGLAALGVRVRFAIDRTTRDTVALVDASGVEVVETSPGEARGHPVLGDSDIVVFDGYAIDIDIEQGWEGRCGLRVAIDDLANRPHACDVLVDHAPGRDAADYAGLVPKDCTVLAGPAFALLRPHFATLRDRALSRRAVEPPRRVLVAMGLTDVGGSTRRAVEGVLAANLGLAIDVVTGRTAQSLPWLHEQARDGVLRLHVDVEASVMAELMVEADIAVGGGGGTSLERCCLGLPSLVIMVADNQERGVLALERAGALTSLGQLDPATPQRIARALATVTREPRLLTDQAQAAAVIVDGGGSRRVSRILLDSLADRR